MGAFTSDSVRRHAPECWFPLAHAEAILAEPRLSLTAFCDADPVQLSRAREAYDVAHGFTDITELARAIRPVLAGIATRTPGRAAIIETLHDHGTRAFHVEKPLCNSVSELERLSAIFSAEDVFVTYGAIRRYFAIYRQAIEVARSGRYGPLLEVSVNFGPGSLYWVHPHAIDLIILASDGDAISGVQARLDNVDRIGLTIASDPLVRSATIWFAGGLVGHIGQAPGLDFELACRDAVITVRADGHGLEIASCVKPDDIYFTTMRMDVAQAAELQGALTPIALLTDCLEGGEVSIVANRRIVSDILSGQRISFAMVQSHLEASRIVPFDSVDPAMTIQACTNGNFA